MSIVFLTPPLTKPSEPGLSAAAAARALRAAGTNAHWIDASIGWHDHALSPATLSASLSQLPHDRPRAWDRALRAIASNEPPLRRASTYADRQKYTSAIGDLEQALRLAAVPYPGIRLGVAMIGFEGRRVESRETLFWFASRPGPFDAYVIEDLIPELDALGAEHVAVSLTFQQQAPAAFRIAHLLSVHRPTWTRWLGGPLVACWMAAGFGLSGAPFSLFHDVVAGDDHDLEAMAARVGSNLPVPLHEGPLAPELEAAPWSSYMTPMPIVPAAVGRGCYWRRCAFCPDHLHRRHQPCELQSLTDWLHHVAHRFPNGAMVHWTDSAVPPRTLEHVAEVIRRDRLPIRWHGFVRVEDAFAEPELAHHLAQGGCAMLQLGVETGSPSLLEHTAKGTDPDRVRRVLEASSRAGILNHVYLLFGLPTESDVDRELTLSLIEQSHRHIHAINPALLNLPLGSPMHRFPARFGITELFSFGGDADLSLYQDFRCGQSHPRSEARRWLGRRFFKHAAVRAIQSHLRTPFKANHLCFIESALSPRERDAPRTPPASPA